LGEESRHLSLNEWFRHSLTKGRRLGQLTSHVPLQALDYSFSIRRLLMCTRRKQLLRWNSLWRGRKSSHPDGSRQREEDRRERTEERERLTSLGFGVAPPGPVYPFLSFIRIHKKESSVKK
jgi:hypothetical protein